MRAPAVTWPNSGRQTQREETLGTHPKCQRANVDRELDSTAWSVVTDWRESQSWSLAVLQCRIVCRLESRQAAG